LRTHWCGELRAEHVGQTVTLAGWVHRRRDHGGVTFLDIRDREGLVQVTLHPEDQPEAHQTAQDVRSEFVVKIEGQVSARPEGAQNLNIPTGEVEVIAKTLEVIATSETPPFQIEDRIDVGEEVRLRYRYLDLRRPEVQGRIFLRHRVTSAIRRFLDDEGFIDVETPMLSKSTPEGSRDYLVPSRLYPGRFYALLQSPQLFKQLLMVAGFDRYYQIVRCFRDEDPRADRQPDFTQLDLEMSFVDTEDVLSLVERLMVKVFADAAGIQIEAPFERMTYNESMARFGIDRPDRRLGLELVDVTDALKGTEAKVFSGASAPGGAGIAIRVPGGGTTSRKELDSLAQVARGAGAGGLAWLVIQNGGVSSPIAKFLTDANVEALISTASAEPNDLLLITTGPKRVVQTALGVVRMELKQRLGLTGDPSAPGYWQPLWVVDTPVVEWNDRESRWDSVHHPFTAPFEEDEHLLDSDPGSVRAKAYDLTLNGIEVAGGSIRIHRPELQRKIFKLIGLDEETVEQRFGWFVDAFRFGAPPHGGIAGGIERLLMALTGSENIRDVMAFPKTSMMTDLLTGAPDEVDEAQLGELHIQVMPAKE